MRIATIKQWEKSQRKNSRNTRGQQKTTFKALIVTMKH